MAALLPQVLVFLSCSAALPAAQSDAEKRLREELVRAHLQILDLKLRLARAGGKPEEEARALEEGLASEHSEVFTAALRELGALPDERRKSGAAGVLRRFAGGEEAFRVPATAFLSRVPSPEAEAAVLEAARDPAPSVRRAAAAALKTFPDEKGAPALAALLRDADQETRIAAAAALGVPKRESGVVPLLAVLAGGPDDPVVEKAADALGSIGSAAAVEPLLRLLETTARKEVRWSCINSLGKIGDPGAAARLRPFLEPGRAPDVRQITIEALGKIKDATVLPKLAEILSSDGEESLRVAAASAVGLMGTPESIVTVLLPAYLKEPPEKVRQTAWEAMLRLAGDSAATHETLARALLAAGRRAEIEQLCALRLHAIKADAATRAKLADLEAAVARAALDAKDPKAAVPHLRQMAAHVPERADVHRQIAACYRELKDPESCLKSLREADTRLAKGEPAWWENRMEILALLREGRDAEALIEEAHALLATNPPPHPEDRRRALEGALRAGTSRLILPLAEKDEAGRKAALDAIRRQGRKILLSLAAAAEESAKSAPAIVEAGNAVAGTAIDPAAADPAKLKEFAAGWRAWFEANKGK